MTYTSLRLLRMRMRVSRGVQMCLLLLQDSDKVQFFQLLSVDKAL